MYPVARHAPIVSQVIYVMVHNSKESPTQGSNVNRPLRFARNIILSYIFVGVVGISAVFRAISSYISVLLPVVALYICLYN